MTKSSVVQAGTQLNKYRHTQLNKYKYTQLNKYKYTQAVDLARQQQKEQ